MPAKQPKPEPKFVAALVLREVATIHGTPAVVFERLLVPDDAEFVCFDVTPVSIEDAKRLIELLERLKT